MKQVLSLYAKLAPKDVVGSLVSLKHQARRDERIRLGKFQHSSRGRGNDSLTQYLGKLLPCFDHDVRA